MTKFLSGTMLSTFSYLVLLCSIYPVNSQIPLTQIPTVDGITGQSQRTPKTYRETLDSESGLTLRWTPDRNGGLVTFMVEPIQENQYVTLALTRRGGLEGSDVIVLGRREDGTPYVIDMYGASNETISEDQTQDWRLVSDNNAVTNSPNGTRIIIERRLDSCDDEQDMVIGGEKFVILYATGEGNVTSEYIPEGSKQMFFLDPAILPESSSVNLQDFPSWHVSRKYVMPEKPVSYWCNIVKLTPSLNTKHHIIGFTSHLPDKNARERVHHMIVYRCVPPPGVDPEELFGPYLNHPGEECYILKQPSLPSFYCREMVHNYAIGGEPVVIPETMGIPIGGSDTFFMFETHYENRDRKMDGVTIENGLDIYYTSELRRDDGVIIFVGYGVLGTFVVPPNTNNFTVGGHCSSDCTAQMLPYPDGMDILGVSLHAHTSGKKIKFKHSRGQAELPWILNYEDYDFQYQQLRMLENPRRVLPGDQLTVECVYDNTWANGSALASGFSTYLDEMCLAFFFVSKPLQYIFCSSEYHTDRTMERFGIKNMAWDIEIQERIITEANDPSLIGLTLSQVVEAQNWTSESIRELEREQRLSNHVTNCPNLGIFRGVSYYAEEFQNATGGIIEFPILDTTTPSITAINSPYPGLIPVRYPAFEYVEPERSCPNGMTNASDTEESMMMFPIPGQRVAPQNFGVDDGLSIISATRPYQNLVVFNPPIG